MSASQNSLSSAQPPGIAGLSTAALVNLSVVSLPLLAAAPSTSVRLDIILFLTAGTSLCVLELTAGAKSSEILTDFSRYRKAALIGGILLLLLQWSCLLEWQYKSSGNTTVTISGFFVAICGCAVRTAAIGNLKDEFNSELSGSRLVTTGLHSLVRHPSETGLILTCAGLAIILQAWWTALLLLPVCCAAAHIRITEEERWLHSRHGTQYATYHNRTGRWLPVIRGVSNCF